MKKLTACIAVLMLASGCKVQAATLTTPSAARTDPASHPLQSDDSYKPVFVTFDTRGLRCVALRDGEIISSHYVALSCVLIDKQQEK